MIFLLRGECRFGWYWHNRHGCGGWWLLRQPEPALYSRRRRHFLRIRRRFMSCLKECLSGLTVVRWERCPMLWAQRQIRPDVGPACAVHQFSPKKALFRRSTPEGKRCSRLREGIRELVIERDRKRSALFLELIRYFPDDGLPVLRDNTCNHVREEQVNVGSGV